MAKVTITLQDSAPDVGGEGCALDLTIKVEMEQTLFTQAPNSISLVLGMGVRNILNDEGAIQRLATIMRSDHKAFMAQLVAMTGGGKS